MRTLARITFERPPMVGTSQVALLTDATLRKWGQSVGALVCIDLPLPSCSVPPDCQWATYNHHPSGSVCLQVGCHCNRVPRLVPVEFCVVGFPVLVCFRGTSFQHSTLIPCVIALIVHCCLRLSDCKDSGWDVCSLPPTNRPSQSRIMRGSRRSSSCGNRTFSLWRVWLLQMIQITCR